MKRISLEALLQQSGTDSYEQQHSYIMGLLNEEKLKPVKASGTNGKKPALYLSYWILEDKKDYNAFKEELIYQLHPGISVDYYLSRLEQYEEDREWVLLLSEFLKERQEKLLAAESVNERSFEIWGREKFLAKEQGGRILKRCGLTEEELNVYDTAEPLAYYSHTKETPQNILILENKDTFYSMRRHLLAGGQGIFGEPVGTLVYGAGKRVLKSFGDFDFCVEPYMAEKDNQIYYFGDLDYEGIGIYEKLASLFEARWEIEPFVPAYQAMLYKAGLLRKLPATSEKQNRNITGEFFRYFSLNQIEQMKEILERGQYIPQEILNISDLDVRSILKQVN